MPSNFIECEGLFKSYEKGYVLNEVSFSAHPGQIIGLVGPSGSGKSTLLQTLVGMHKYEGSSKVMGLESYGNRVNILSNTCFVPDVAVLANWMRVWQCFKIMGSVYPQFDETRARQILQRLKINDQDKVETLSKGMKAQLHLAMCLSVPSEILLLDEPTLGLDPLAREWFYNWLINDYHNADRLIIISSHVIDEIDHIITDTIFLKQGYVDRYQPIDTLKADYICLQIEKKPELLQLARQSRFIHESMGAQHHDFLFDRQDYMQVKDGLNKLGTEKEASLSQIFKAHFHNG